MNLLRVALGLLLLAGCSSASAAGQGNAGASTSIAPLSPAIYPAANQWANSAGSTTETIQSIPATRVSGQAQLLLDVPTGTTSLTVWLANNLTGSTFETGTGVYVDGAYSTSFNPAAGSAQTLTPFALSLNGAHHTVSIWGGYLQGKDQGTYVWAVQGQGISVNPIPSRTLAVACYGDSTTMGGGTSPSAQKSWFALLRALAPNSFAMEAWGGRQLWDDSGTGSGQQGFASTSLLAARLVALDAGATTRYVIILIGINDSGGGHGGTFPAEYASLLAAINSQDPGIHVLALGGLTGVFSSQIQTACVAAGSFCTYVDSTTLFNNAIGVGMNADNVHPNNDGDQAIALGTGPAVGSGSNLRTLLGI